MYLCVRPIFWYFIFQLLDLKFIQVTYRAVFNSLKTIDLHRSKVKVTGTVYCFLKVRKSGKNLEKVGKSGKEW